MITQERSDALSLLVKQKQRKYKERFAEVYLGERLNGEDQQELNTDSPGPGSELGGAAESEPTSPGPGQHPSGDESERPAEAEAIS